MQQSDCRIDCLPGSKTGVGRESLLLRRGLLEHVDFAGPRASAALIDFFPLQDRIDIRNFPEYMS